MTIILPMILLSLAAGGVALAAFLWSVSNGQYDDIEGAVANLATDMGDPGIKTFTIMGVPVRASSTSTNFEGEDDPGFSFDTIMEGDVVEAHDPCSARMKSTSRWIWSSVNVLPKAGMLPRPFAMTLVM